MTENVEFLYGGLQCANGSQPFLGQRSGNVGQSLGDTF